MNKNIVSSFSDLNKITKNQKRLFFFFNWFNKEGKIETYKITYLFSKRESKYIFYINSSLIWKFPNKLSMISMIKDKMKKLGFKDNKKK